MQPEKQYDPYSKPVAVAYIGKKDIKRDTLCRSGVVWSGFGDVQHVDARVASRLLVHKDVFVPAEKLEEIKKQMQQSVQDDIDNELSGETKVDAKSTESAEDEGETVDLEPIKNAIAALDQENEDHFTGAGKPKVAAVRSFVDNDSIEVTAELVNKAFAELGGE